MDSQVFRIEIPVEVKNETDTQQFETLEEVLKNAADNAGKLGDKLSNAGSQSKGAFDGASDGVRKIGTSMDQTSSKTDIFLQKMQKTEQHLSKMTKTPHEILLKLKDQATAAIKNVLTILGNVAGKAWTVTMKLKDLVTAPLRAIKNLIINPVTMAAGAMGLSFGASDVLNTYTGFEQQMANVRALTQATDEDFARLNATAKNLGATTKFTAEEAAEGMQYLGMAGWNTEQILDAMPGLLSLAAAGATDLGTASDIVSDVMTAFGMKAGDAQKAADVFAKTASSSNTSISMLGETMKYAAPIARQFGMNLEETSAIAGMMANAGIKASQAGTSMRTAFLRFSKMPKEGAERMEKLNLTFTKANGQMKDMSTIVRELETKFKAMSESERLAAANDIFGKTAASGWLSVLSQGADEYDRFLQNLYNSQGASEQMAETQLDNLAGDITLLQSAFDGLKLAVGDKLSGAGREIVQWVTDQIPGATKAITDFIDEAGQKIAEFKEIFTGTINSEEFKNADFFGKIQIAWNDMIVEPFSEWWNNGGQKSVVGIAGDIGESIGSTISGILTGGLALIAGDEVDAESLNLSPIASAGLEVGSEFAKKFFEGFNFEGVASMAADAIGNVVNDALKLLPGGQEASDTSWLSALIVGAGAAEIAGVLGDVGINFTTIGEGLELMGTGLELVASLGAPAMIAAGVVATAAVGIKLYADSIAQYETNLSNMASRIDEAVNAYNSAKNEAETILNKISEARELEAQLDASNKYDDTEVAEMERRIGELDEHITSIRESMNQLAKENGFDNIQIADKEVEKFQAIESAINTLASQKTSLKDDFEMGKIDSEEFESGAEAIDAKMKELQDQKEALGGSIDFGGFYDSYTQLMKDLELAKQEQQSLVSELSFINMTDEQKDAIIGRLREIYGEIIALSDGLITQQDLENGSFERKLELLEKIAQMQKDIAAADLQEQTKQILKDLPEVGTRRVEAKKAVESDIDAYGQYVDLRSEVAEMKARAIELTSRWELAEKHTGLKDAYGQDLWTDAEAQKAWYKEAETFLTESTSAYNSHVPEGKEQIKTFGMVPFGKFGFDYMNYDVNSLINGDFSSTVNGIVDLFDEGTHEINNQMQKNNAEYTKWDKAMKDSYNSTVSSLEALYLNGESFSDAAARYASMNQEEQDNFSKAVDELREYNSKFAEHGLEDLFMVDPTNVWGQAADAAQKMIDNIDNPFRHKENIIKDAENIVKESENYANVLDSYNKAMALIANYEANPSNQNAAKAIIDFAQQTKEVFGAEWAISEDWYNGSEFVADGLSKWQQSMQGYMTVAENNLKSSMAQYNSSTELHDLEMLGKEYESNLKAKMTVMDSVQENIYGLGEYMAGSLASGTYAGREGDMLARYNTLSRMAATAVPEIEMPKLTAEDFDTAHVSDTINMLRSIKSEKPSDDWLGFFGGKDGLAGQIADVGAQLTALGQIMQKTTEINAAPQVNTDSVEEAKKAVVAYNEEVGNMTATAPETTIDATQYEEVKATVEETGASIQEANAVIAETGQVSAESVAAMNEAIAQTGQISSDTAAIMNTEFFSAVQSLGEEGLANLMSVAEAFNTVYDNGSKLDTLTLSIVKAALDSVTAKANSASGAVASVKSELEALNGTTAHTYIYVHEIRTSSSSGGYGGRAKGGIITSPELSWIGEDGPEAIIPLGSDKRDRALDLWYTAGHALGIPAYANGDIIGDIGTIESDNDKPVHTIAPGGNADITINSPINMTINVEGASNPEAVYQAIVSKKLELADMLSGTISEVVKEELINKV